MDAMSELTSNRVVVGMSGGVDSSAAAAVLIEKGYEVIGITLKLWPQDCVSRAEDKCCGPQAVMDARSVSHQLKIPYYLVDESADFQQHVIQYFAEEYKAGRTPNPCVMCNEKLKFGTLLERARQLGAHWIATGHYARVVHGQPQDRVILKKGLDPRKDQSYFLFSLRQEYLRHLLFPLGELTKSDSREVARDCSLRTADKEESMEICFVPDNDYRGFLTQSKLVGVDPGDIVDLQGKCWVAMMAWPFTPLGSVAAGAFFARTSLRVGAGCEAQPGRGRARRCPRQAFLHHRSLQLDPF